MAAETTDEVLRAPLVIEYPFRRTTGPVIGAFFTAVREGRLLGIKAADGSVICPPQEYDPVTLRAADRAGAGGRHRRGGHVDVGERGP
jgi:hypothetical protein